jgi:hypothetical protein
MCANKPTKTAGADVYAGTTIDQIIAQKIGQDNLMPSMQLAVEDPGANSSNCGEGYSCTYTNTISWATPTSPLPMELNPQVVFERMFGDGSTVDQRAKRRRRDGSILDSLTGSLSRLRNESSAQDRARINDYAETVREIVRHEQDSFHVVLRDSEHHVPYPRRGTRILIFSRALGVHCLPAPSPSTLTLQVKRPPWVSMARRITAKIQDELPSSRKSINIT